MARAVVIGGGCIGLEMAEGLVQRGVELALVQQGRQPMSTLDPDNGSLVADAVRNRCPDVSSRGRVP